jgi:hypothetical protein
MSSNQSVRTHGQYQQALTLECALNPNNGQGCIEQCCTQNHLNFFWLGFGISMQIFLVTFCWVCGSWIFLGGL